MRARTGAPIHARTTGAWTNPYARQVSDFPDSLFLFDDFSSASMSLRERCCGKRVWVELGSGSGRHLIEQSIRNPEVTCVGFEMRYKRAVRTVVKAQERGASNLLLALTDARLFAEIFGPRSIEKIFVNFPDPWPKSRWEKHRLLARDLFIEAAFALVPGGVLRIKTDHRDAFDEVVALGGEEASFDLIAKTHDLHSSAWSGENILTEFEALFLSQQQPICFAEFRTRSE